MRAPHLTRIALRLAATVTLLLPAAARADASSSPVAHALELLEKWDIEGAQTIARQLEQSAPDDPGTKFLLGRVAFENGDYGRAAELLREALGPAAEKNADYALAAAAEAETRNTVVEESAHFSVRYRPGKDAALVPYTLDTLEAAYAALVQDLDYVPAGKIRVEIYNSPKALARVSSLSEEAIKTTGIIALCKYNRLMVTSPRALWRGYDWQDTLTHEFVHFLVTKKSRNTVPIWLHEGIAKYLETRWRGAPGLALEKPAEALLQRAVKNDALIPFARMHPSIALLPSQEDAALAFAQVFTVIEMVDQRAGIKGLRKIIDTLKAGGSDREAVGAALSMTFEQFEARWKQSLRARPAVKTSPRLEKLVFRDDRKQPESKEERTKAYERGELGTLPSSAAKHAHLGELLRARSRLAAASVEYEKAIALAGPTHPPLARKYALTQLALGRSEKAEKALRASLAAEPDDQTNHLLLGRILVQTDRHAEAKDHLLIANRRDPFDEEIHANLLAVGRALSDESLVIRERDVLSILSGEKLTWRAARPGEAAAGTGYLRIEAPGGARVLIDGVDTGLTTPVAEHPLPAGEHVVRLEKDGEPAVERTIHIGVDEIVPFTGT